MADDIVNRLRDYNCRCTFVVKGVVGIICEACEAADEIERLRAVVRKHQMLIAIEADMAVDEAKTDLEREAEAWVRPRPPRKPITLNIRIDPGKALQERYGGDINAWALDIAETIKRNMRNEEARRG